MPLEVKITPLSQSYQVLVDQTLSPKARSARVADFARRQIRAADEINRRAFGAVPPKKVTVNGREDEFLNNIPPDSGTIIAEYRLVDDVLAWIMTTLRQRSPVISGAYRDGHRMFADDVEADAFEPPIASQYTFFNLVPYARKIEVGKTEAGRAFVIQVENRIYARTAEDAKAKFGNVVKIRAGFASTPSAYRLKRSTGRRKSRAAAVVTSPAIYPRSSRLRLRLTVWWCRRPVARRRRPR
jgi:hypothetical protein